MSNSIGWYWLVGCVVIGVAFGANVRECPKDDYPAADLLIKVIIWPVIVTASFGKPLPAQGCRVATEANP